MKLLHVKKGFTLIELMVSVSIFMLVMTISMGAILSIIDANHKSQTLRSVMDNLDSTLETMTRSIRFGTKYHASSSGTVTQPRDTQAGDDMTSMSVRDSDGNEVTYALSGGQITRTINGSAPLALTSPDVVIQSLSFRVFGSRPYTDVGYGSDSYQPMVIVIVKGVVTQARNASSSFTIETMISQRQLDSI